MSMKTKTSKKMKILISTLFDEESPIDDLFDITIPSRNVEILNNPEVAAIVIWGGEDISPGIYGQSPSRFTDARGQPSKRDKEEMEWARLAIEKKIPIIGICRGAQLMCAVSGGSLIQHVSNHAGPPHRLSTIDGKEIWTNSVHHQMMNPFKVDHELIACAPEKLSTTYIWDCGSEVVEAYGDNFKEA